MICGIQGTRGAAGSGVGLRDLMARMGHDSERAAIIYQPEARGADAAITKAIDAHVEPEQSKGDDDRALPGPSLPSANGTRPSPGIEGRMPETSSGR
jgi:hypothetical protein